MRLGKNILVWLAASSTLFCVPAVAESAPDSGEKSAPKMQMPWPIEVVHQAFEDDRQADYLDVVLELLERESETESDPMVRRIYLDYLGAQLVMVGEHDRALEISDEAFGAQYESDSAEPEGPDPLKGYEPVDALEEIVRRAESRQLLMINEEHRSTVQRAFAHRLLEPLWGLGYRYLAVETLAEDAAQLAERGYPLLSTGTYTKDPVLGDLLRRALDLGYQLVPYEASVDVTRPRPDDTSPVDAANRRERAQAENLFSRTLERDPEAKVLVYAGRDHISESKGGAWVPMGTVLKELSGVDPLTVSMMKMVEHSEDRYEHWAFARASQAGWLEGDAILLRNEAGALWTANPRALDAHLFHPRTRSESGRPQWMEMGGLRRPVEFELPEFDEPVLLQAALADESPGAVPVDQLLLWPKQPPPPLMLRPGTYVVRVLARSGETLHRDELSVTIQPSRESPAE